MFTVWLLYQYRKPGKSSNTETFDRTNYGKKIIFFWENKNQSGYIKKLNVFFIYRANKKNMINGIWTDFGDFKKKFKLPLLPVR